MLINKIIYHQTYDNVNNTQQLSHQNAKSYLNFLYCYFIKPQLQLFFMHPFNCLIQRRINQSPNPISSFPSSTLLWPKSIHPINLDQSSNNTLPHLCKTNPTKAEPIFPINRNIESNKSVQLLGQNHCPYDTFKKEEKEDKSSEIIKLNIKDINHRLSSLNIQQKHQVQNDEYVRVWFQNLAMREKLKLM